MAGLVRVLKHKWVTGPKVVTESYEGRNIIVTGANTGIGFEAASKFAEAGAAKVILAVRNLEKGEKAKTIIESRTHQSCHLEVWELDMSSFDSVVAFAERARGLDHLDIAVLNAGVYRNVYNQSKHGWEEDLQVNTLSTTLLSILLLPKLKASKQHSGKTPVLEIISSGLHQRVQLDSKVLEGSGILDAYNSQEKFGAGAQYSRSKLFLIYATNKLAELIPSSDVIITSVCPGMVQSDLGRDYKFPGSTFVVWAFGVLLQRSTEQGARVYISGATAGEKAHGRFYQYDEIQPIGPTIAGEANKKVAERVWAEIVGILSKDVPNFKEHLQEISSEH